MSGFPARNHPVMSAMASSDSWDLVEQDRSQISGDGAADGGSVLRC